MQIRFMKNDDFEFNVTHTKLDKLIGDKTNKLKGTDTMMLV